MTQKTIDLANHYITALRAHLRTSTTGKVKEAVVLGREAVVCGLETLQIARIHEQAIVALGLARRPGGQIKRAEIFFAEVITPIVQTHRMGRQNAAELKQLEKTLSLRTEELAATHRQLQRGIIRRKSLEASLKKSGEHYSKLLKASLQLQQGLRQLTYQVLAAQEDDRRNISRELQDDIAQTLLGINVRLLSLKHEAKVNTKSLKNEIASTQRLVARSARSVRRVARELDR